MNASLPASAVAFCLTALVCRRPPDSLPSAANFEGRTVRAAGALLVIAILSGIVVAAWAAGQWTGCEHGAAFIAVAGFGVFGWLDDRYGDRSASGFRGHLGAALKGRFTTGFWKVVGGGATAMAAAWLALPGRPAWHWLPAAACIALSANALNLVDTRPVRSVLAFVAIGIPVWLATKSDAVAAGLGGALAWLPADRGRRVLLGDAGSNALGALLAVTAIPAMPLYAILAALVLLVAFHVWAERYSLNAFVARRPALARFDAWVRGGG